MFNRRVRFWLVVGLLVSNLGVGLLSLFYLRTVNERYAMLFERSIPVVNQLRTLTRELGTVQRLARRVVDPDNEPKWRELAPEMERISVQSREHAREIGGAEWFRGTTHAAALPTLGAEYDARVSEFLRLVAAGRLAEANQFNTERLRPTYDTLQVALDAAADFVEDEGNSLRSRYARESRFFGGLLLVLASWPVLAAVVGIAMLCLVVLALIATVFTPQLGGGTRRAAQ